MEMGNICLVALPCLWAILGWQNGSILAKVAVLLHPCLVTISESLPSIDSKPESLFYLFQLSPTSASCVPSPRTFLGILPQTPKSPHLQAHLLNSTKHPVSSKPTFD